MKNPANCNTVPTVVSVSADCQNYFFPMTKLLAVDKDLWTKEVAEMRRYYKEEIADKGGRLPAALTAQLDALEARINK